MYVYIDKDHYTMELTHDSYIYHILHVCHMLHQNWVTMGPWSSSPVLKPGFRTESSDFGAPGRVPRDDQ